MAESIVEVIQKMGSMIPKFRIVNCIMETLRIDIVNPKAKRIIKELAELNLIIIRVNDPVKSFQGLLNKLRSRSNVISVSPM